MLIYYKGHDNIPQAQNYAKIDRAKLYCAPGNDLEASKSFYVEQIGLCIPAQSTRRGCLLTPNLSRLRSGHRWLTSMQLASWDGGCLFGSPQRMPMRSTRNWWRKAYFHPFSTPADGPFGRFFAFRDPDHYAITVHTQKSQNRQRQDLDASSGYLTFINTFSVEPENADHLVENLQKATEEIFRDQPGFISANLHVQSRPTQGRQLRAVEIEGRLCGHEQAAQHSGAHEGSRGVGDQVVILSTTISAP